MRIKLFALAILAVALMSSAVADVAAGSDRSRVRAELSGYQEVPTLSNAGTGRFDARIDDEAGTITFRLTYRGLSAAASAAHIHLGARAVNGGVSAFLCGGGSKPACPAGTTTEAMVTGTIVAADVIGPVDQGIAAGEFGELVAALRAGATYANVHNSVRPGGEIRGQINDGDPGNDRDDD